MDTSPSCSEFRSALPLYVGGDLDPQALTAARRHVEGCAPCAAALADASAARATLRGLLEADARAAAAAPDLWPGVRAALAAEGLLATPAAPPAAEPVPVRSLAAARARRRRAGLAAAAALLLLLAGGGLWVELRRPTAAPLPAGAPALAERGPGAPAGAGARPAVDPVALQPLDPSAWPAAVRPTVEPEPAIDPSNSTMAAGARRWFQ